MIVPTKQALCLLLFGLICSLVTSVSAQEDDTQFDKNFEALKVAFENEEVDKDWASDMKVRIQAYVEDGTEGTAEMIACKSTMCRVRIKYDGENKAEFQNALMELPNNIQTGRFRTFIRLHSKDPYDAEVFFSRVGFRFPYDEKQ